MYSCMHTKQAVVDWHLAREKKKGGGHLLLGEKAGVLRPIRMSTYLPVGRNRNISKPGKARRLTRLGRKKKDEGTGR